MTDLEFVQRCVHEEKEAWDEFIDRYSRLIYSYILSVLRQKAPELSIQDHAQDIFHEIFLTLRKNDSHKLKTYQAKNGCTLASWLRQVAINFSLCYLRRLKPAISLDEPIGQDQEQALKDLLVDDGTSVRETFVLENRLKNLKNCIRQLESDDRFFLKLHIHKELTLENIQQILRVSRGTVDMRKARILQRLRDCFRQKGFVVKVS